MKIRFAVTTACDGPEFARSVHGTLGTKLAFHVPALATTQKLGGDSFSEQTTNRTDQFDLNYCNAEQSSTDTSAS